MYDALAFAAATMWLALNIWLWIVVEDELELFGWSLGLGAIYCAGFFSYLGHRDRR